MASGKRSVGEALDAALAALSPSMGAKRAKARAMIRHYEASRPNRNRPGFRSTGSGNTVLERAGKTLREQARYLDENHDLGRSVLNVLVARIIGRGLTYEPTIRDADGTLHDQFNDDVLTLFQRWARRPEVTRRMHLAASERIGCRTWLRDGEVLGQHLSGNIRGLLHYSDVPYSLELIEPDQLLFEHNSDRDPRIVQGVELSGWGRPVAYHIAREHPGNAGARLQTSTRRIKSERISHVYLSDRISQVRGVTIFASVLQRLEHLKDYETSERIAAKVAASMAAYIKKGTPDQYDESDADEEKRELTFKAGMIFDDLRIGEDVGTIDTTRPSNRIGEYRRDQLRAVSGGTQAGYSSIARDYDGSYSSQRQELVEGQENYELLRDHWREQWSRPMYSRFMGAALASGLLVPPREIDLSTVFDVEIGGPGVPFIDPKKEGDAVRENVRAGHMSSTEAVRSRGGNIAITYRQLRRERDLAERYGLTLTSDPAKDSSPAAQGNDNAEEDEDEESRAYAFTN